MLIFNFIHYFVTPDVDQPGSDEKTTIQGGIFKRHYQQDKLPRFLFLPFSLCVC